MTNLGNQFAVHQTIIIPTETCNSSNRMGVGSIPLHQILPTEELGYSSMMGVESILYVMPIISKIMKGFNKASNSNGFRV